VGFFAKQIFGSSTSQIETKHVFNLAGVLKTLKHYHL
jgi:hypothetical protein